MCKELVRKHFIINNINISLVNEFWQISCNVHIISSASYIVQCNVVRLLLKWLLFVDKDSLTPDLDWVNLYQHHTIHSTILTLLGGHHHHHTSPLNEHNVANQILIASSHLLLTLLQNQKKTSTCIQSLVLYFTKIYFQALNNLNICDDRKLLQNSWGSFHN